MDQQRLCINAATGEVSATNVSQGVPALSGILRTLFQLRVTFEEDNVPVALPAGTTGKFVAKVPGAESGPAVLLDAAWVASGTGAQTAYAFAVLADNVQLRAALGDAPAIALTAQVEWQISGEEAPRCSVPFPLVVSNSPSRPEDGAPDPVADAAWLWFKLRHIAGSNVTLTFDDVNKTMTVSAAGASAVTSVAWAAVTGKPSSFPSAWADVTGKPSTFPPSTHSHSWSQISSGSPSDNAALVSFVLANASAGQNFDILIPLVGGDNSSFDSYDTEMKPILVFPRDAVITHISLAVSQAEPRASDLLWQVYLVLYLSRPNTYLGYDWSQSTWYYETFIDASKRGVGIPLLVAGEIGVLAGTALDLDLHTGAPDAYSSLPTFAQLFIRVRGRYTS